MVTTIQLREKTRDLLKSLATKGETYDDVIVELAAVYDAYIEGLLRKFSCTDVERKLKRPSKRSPKEYHRLSKALGKLVETGRGLVPIRPPLFRMRAGDWRIFVGEKRSSCCSTGRGLWENSGSEGKLVPEPKLTLMCGRLLTTFRSTA
ncbi:MAG: hypothetical protein J7J17_01565 [Hadesarchaea archaeon]|nr:hypothetical protein [Hadesarchaea archaeon]